MAQRVFVKVVGFSAAERHALNTLFRLSEEQHAGYSLWVPGAPEAPRLLVIDADSPNAAAEAQALEIEQAKVIWVGPGAPASSWRAFTRPISWPDVVTAMDALFAPAGGALDFDLGSATDALDTQPPDDTSDGAAAPARRALIACADRDQRLYLRARLALAGLTEVDEAGSAAQALIMAQGQSYRVALVGHALPGVDGWALLKGLRAAGAGSPAVILTKDGRSMVDRFRARFGGAAALLETPPDPVALDAALRKVAGAPESVFGARSVL